jgi:hypothetical protein
MKILTICAGVLGFAAVAAAMIWQAQGAREAPADKQRAVRLEAVPGSEAKRVILTAKALERLGIETGKVSEQPIVRKRMVGGLVTSAPRHQPEAPMPGPGFAGFGRALTASAEADSASAGATAAAKGQAWVLVTLSQAEWEGLAKDKPARLLPLTTRDGFAGEILARPSGLAPVEDVKRSMLRAYYVVSAEENGLALNTRMRVELQLSGDDEKRRVVPYSAVYYDAKGIPWVYLNPEPLVFERRRIGVERIVGELAILAEGPDVGTAVVTVGAPLLYGAEIFKK